MQMRKTIQTVLIHVLTILLAFAASLIFFNHRISAEKGNPVAELAGPTYPVMSIEGDDGEYNIMSAYRGDIDLSLVRNQVTVTDYTKTLNIRLYQYDYDITAIQYELFTNNLEEPLEEGTVNQLQEEDNYRKGQIVFTEDLKEGKTYYLRMAVRLNNSTRAYFYTKLQSGSDYHLNEYFTYVREFHENLFDKEAMEKNAVYLEPVAGQVDRSLNYVDIHSSIDAVFFGSMKVKQEREPVITVREINDTYAVLELNGILSSEVSDGVVQYYDVKETYKLRYTPERMFLLDYNRTMGAYYNESMIDSANNYLGLGIQDKNGIDYLSSDKGRRLCFISEGQLWYYDYNASNVTRVYSLTSENLSDLRNNGDEHGLKILDMDDKGNITYLVYGYMSRGRHEGANGIEIIRFDAETNCNETLSFLATSVPYDTMKEDISKLSYLNGENVFYCILDGDLHEVDIRKKTDKILKSGLVNESLTASKDQSIIAIEKNQNILENREIEVIQLETGESRLFSCKEDERIRSIGFLSDDFIYGTADAANTKKERSGAILFPMEQIHIMSIDGKEIKKYSKAGKYILKTEIDGSVLEMKFGQKKGGTIKQIGEKDYIRYKEEENTEQVSLVSKHSDTYGDQMYFRFPEYVYIQIEPDLVLSRILTSEDDVSLTLEKGEDTARQYYIYADGQKKESYTNLSEAVRAAAEERGNVIDSNEKVLWQCVFDEYHIVAGMDRVTKVSSDKDSLAACLSMFASVNGKNVTVSQIKRKDGTMEDLLAQCTGYETLNLTGCSIDEVLYYISQGSPVLARYSSGRFVVIMSYNSTKLRYLDPVTGKSTAVSRTELTDTLRKAGNEYYSYLEE